MVLRCSLRVLSSPGTIVATMVEQDGLALAYWGSWLLVANTKDEERPTTWRMLEAIMCHPDRIIRFI
jgi:hypothetical protein